MTRSQETVRLATADRLTVIAMGLTILGATFVVYLQHRDQLVRQEGQISTLISTVHELAERVHELEVK